MVTTSLASRPRVLAAPIAVRPGVVSIRNAPPSGAWGGGAHDIRERVYGDHLLELDAVFGTCVKMKRGDALYRAGSPFTALHAIRVGTFKTLLLAQDGREQVIGLHMDGDILGLDCIGSERHACEAIALEDSEVCALPFDKLDELARREPALRHTLYRLMARNLRRSRDMMMLLGSLSAEERLAAFLIDLAECFRRGGHSGSEFALRMTRAEIASFLGLKLETVSRNFSRLKRLGAIEVQGRAVKLLDSPALARLAGHGLPRA